MSRFENSRIMVSKLMNTGFFHIFGSSTINKIVHFAYGILIVRIIPKENYGIYSYANTVYSIFMLLSGFGIVSAILQVASEKADNIDNRKKISQYGMMFGIKFNFILSGLILVLAWFIPLPIAGSNQLLIIMSLLPILTIIKEVQKIELRVSLRNVEYSKYNTIDSVLIALGTIFGAIIFQEKGMIFGHYIVAIAMILILKKSTKIPSKANYLSLNSSEKNDILKIAGISTLTNGLSQLLSLLGTLILGIIVTDPSIIASYKIASIIPTALNFIPGALMIYAYPYFARNKRNRVWVIASYKNLMIYGSLFFLFISLIGIIFAKSIIGIIFGPDYLEATSSFQILMASFFIGSTFRTIAGNLLVTQRKLLLNLLNGVICTIISILLNIILIPKFGSEGAALSQFVTIATSGILYTIWFIKVLGQIEG